ncbi:hypothetical protein L596_021725 [Steinernema carpocapsae]|uniref:Uncharacterized protein n=1 Tax=Steinernema carpocapsae TaxID=34508 RepID=A0A4V6A003_STECR|nr:hypothetical protein L596_021725 [Steinernema carpocapsae]
MKTRFSPPTERFKPKYRRKLDTRARFFYVLHARRRWPTHPLTLVALLEGYKSRLFDCLSIYLVFWFKMTTLVFSLVLLALFVASFHCEPLGEPEVKLLTRVKRQWYGGGVSSNPCYPYPYKPGCEAQGRKKRDSDPCQGIPGCEIEIRAKRQWYGGGVSSNPCYPLPYTPGCKRDGGRRKRQWYGGGDMSNPCYPYPYRPGCDNDGRK